MSGDLYVNLDEPTAHAMAQHPEITQPGTKAILHAVFAHNEASGHIEFGGVITTPDGCAMVCLECGKQLPILPPRDSIGANVNPGR